MNQTFFFYDLETSGLDAREDRIMQFAGQRTDLDLNPIGEPFNILVKMAEDTLPNPGGIKVTKITPQSTLSDGITEADFCKLITEKVFTPNTIAIGFNTIRFDDEFMRHLFWRNFYDPYEFEWKDGRSRWDLLDVVRITRALRPEGINWPLTEDGKATNRLELITKLNGIEHEHAHDALADVFASIAVAKLIKNKQPDLFGYLFKNRNKNEIKKLVNLENKKPFVYSSGKYSSEFNKTTVAFPLTTSRNGNILVYDLRYDVEKLDDKKSTFPIVKEFAFNKCPVVAPVQVLDKDDGWQKIKLEKNTIEENLKKLLAHPEFAEKMREEVENKPEFPPAIDPESALYDGFLNDHDRIRCNAIRNADETKLADFHPDFTDERLPELLLHYKAKNFPKSLSESEQQKWEDYKNARLNRQSKNFLKELEKVDDEFIAEELKLYYESLINF